MTTLTNAAAADLFRAPPDRWIPVAEGEVAYRRVGSGPDVLFVHGWPVSGATFYALMPHLAPHLTCHVIDLVGTGTSRFDRSSRLSIEHHIDTVRRVVEALDLEQYAAVGHNSGGMIARHAVVGDPRLRALGLIDTELPGAQHWRFSSFLAVSRVPGFMRVLSTLIGSRSLRQNKFVLGDAFADPSLLDGTFDEFFLAPLRDNPELRWAAGQLLESFEQRHLDELATIHPRIEVPVQMVWGEHDPFFPVARAREMVDSFPDANLQVVKDAKLFVHEERPAEVAAALLPVLVAQ